MLCVAVLSLTSCLVRAEPAVQMDRAMVIDGVIQGDNLAALNKALLSKKSGDVVDLVISSPGGSIVTGFEFVSNMEAAKQRGVTINCFVVKYAASMAFQILLHCDSKYVLDRSFLLWHRARVMLGGFGGEPMTSPQLSALGRDLEKTDSVILAEVLKYMQMEESDIKYHFEHETLHIGEQLAKESNTFESYPAIPGLMEALGNQKIPRTKEEDLFSKLFGGGDIDYSQFRFGEIIYVKPSNIKIN